MDKNPLLHRIMKVDKKDAFHSSGYAKTQNQGSIGSASCESFLKRRKIDKNRSTIGKYGASQIANSHYSNTPGAKTYDPAASTKETPATDSSRYSARTQPTKTSAPPPPQKPTPPPRINPGITR